MKAQNFTLFDNLFVLFSNDKQVVFIGVAGKIYESQSKNSRLKF